MKKSLEIKVLELKDEISDLEERVADKKHELREAEEELRSVTLLEKTNDVSIGDSLFFEDEDGCVLETMLVSDGKGHLDLVLLTDYSHELESMVIGRKLDMRHFHIDSLIQDVEDDYDWKFSPQDN